MSDEHQADDFERDPETPREAWLWILNKTSPHSNPLTAIATIVTAIATTALVGVTIAYTIYSARQWRAAEENAAAANTAADVAKETLEQSNRPWVSATIEKTGPLQFAPSGAQIPIRFTLKNVGHGPALNVRHRANIVILPERTFSNVELREAEQAECQIAEQGQLQLEPPLFPGDFPQVMLWPASISKASIEKGMQARATGQIHHVSGTVSLYVVACVDYTFPFGQKHGQLSYGFMLGIPIQSGIWMGDLKPEGTRPEVSLFLIDSFAN